MAGRLCPRDRQSACSARLGVFASWRWIDRDGADRSCRSPLDTAVAARRNAEVAPSKRLTLSEPQGPGASGRKCGCTSRWGVASRAREIGAAFAKALEIAERLGDADRQLRALSGLNFYHTGSSGYRAALPFAQRFHDLATRGSNLDDRLFGERMMGVAEHFLGDQIGRAGRGLNSSARLYPPSTRDGISFAFRPTYACRRAPISRGCYGCKDFRSRRRTLPRRA